MELKILSPMCRAIQYSWAMSRVWTVAACEKGVNRKADVVYLQQSMRQRSGIGISHYVYNNTKRISVWTMVCKGSNCTMNWRTELGKNAGNDSIVVDINTLAENIIMIINIFNQRATETGERAGRRQNGQQIIRQGGGGMLLAGDYDTHSYYSDPRCTQLRKATK